MAQGKKSFIAYSDWKEIFDELPNEDAGALVKHIFAYVNDENPVSDSVLIRAVFANIKATLKRDLEKWDSQIQQRVEAGKQSALKRASTKANETPTVVEDRERNPTDSVSVSVSDSDIGSEKGKPIVKKKREAKPFTPPTIDETKSYFKENGYTEQSASKAFNYYNVANWFDSKGNAILNWKQKMQSVWFKDENKDKSLQPKQQPKLSF